MHSPGKLFRKHPQSSARDREKNRITFFPNSLRWNCSGEKRFLFGKIQSNCILSDTIRTGSWMVNLAGELEVPFSHELSAFCGDDSVCFAEEMEIVSIRRI